MNPVPAPKIVQALETESRTLAWIVTSPEAAEFYIETLTPDDFGNPTYMAAFESAAKLQLSDRQVTSTSVADDLASKKVLGNGRAQEQELWIRVLTESESVSEKDYVKESNELVSTLNDYKNRRTLYKMAHTMAESANDFGQSTDEIVESSLTYAEEKFENIQSGKEVTAQEDIAEIDEHLQVIKDNSGIVYPGLGIETIDQAMGGFQPEELVILAARPSRGKTAMMVSAIVGNIEERQIDVFTYEMSRIQIVRRVICAKAGIEYKVLSTDEMNAGDLEKYKQAKSWYLKHGRNLKIHERAYQINTLCVKVKAAFSEGSEQVWIDYLGLVPGDGTALTREQEVSYMTRKLKRTAKICGKPIIALSQLKRGGINPKAVKEKDIRPNLELLRESGAIEQDADKAIFVHLFNQFEQEQETAQGKSTSGAGWVWNLKNRNGKLSDHHIAFDGKSMLWRDWKAGEDLRNAQLIRKQSGPGMKGAPIPDLPFL